MYNSHQLKQSLTKLTVSILTMLLALLLDLRKGLVLPWQLPSTDISSTSRILVFLRVSEPLGKDPFLPRLA